MEKEVMQKVQSCIALSERIGTAIFWLRRQNFDRGMRSYQLLIGDFTAIWGENAEQILNIVDPSICLNDIVNATLKDILDAQVQRDYVLLADLLELQLLPISYTVRQALEENINEDTFTAIFEQNRKALHVQYPALEKELVQLSDTKETTHAEYQREPTATGRMTLKINRGQKQFYLHSNNNPLQEGLELAYTYYCPESQGYIVYGCGLGYHIRALRELGAGIIDVYEADIHILYYTFMLNDMTDLWGERIRLHYDPDYKMLSERLKMDKESVLLLHYPSIQNIQESAVRKRFEQLFIQDSSIRNQLGLLYQNFYSNQKYCTNYVDELEEVFRGKTVYLIAAGPSLDKNINLLKNKPKNSVIVAVGTVLWKLLNLKIDMDFVIVADANARVYNQVNGIEACGVPMIILSTAYEGFAKNYQSSKYLVCQKDFEPAQQYARKYDRDLYETGGSVITTALDIALHLKAARVIFVGLDLAYTDNLAHATQTSRRDIFDTEQMSLVPAVNGGTVYASNSFVMFREWIEKRMKQSDIECIDATEGGAKIKGCKIMSLKEAITLS